MKTWIILHWSERAHLPAQVFVCERAQSTCALASRVRTFMLHFDSPLFEPNEKNLITDCMLFGNDFAVPKKIAETLYFSFAFVCFELTIGNVGTRNAILMQTTHVNIQPNWYFRWFLLLYFSNASFALYRSTSLFSCHCKVNSRAARSNDEY